MIEDKLFTPDEVFGLIGREYLERNSDIGKRDSDMVLDGIHIYRASLRYMTFYQKGMVCPSCGKVGTHFRLCGDSESNRRHFNLYADDGTLFTKDHIIPKSKGGANKVENLQPMCVNCNKAKGNYCPDIKVAYIVAANCKNGCRLEFREIKQAARHIVLSYLRPSKKNMNNIVDCSINAVLKIQDAIKTGDAYAGFFWTVEER